MMYSYMYMRALLSIHCDSMRATSRPRLMGVRLEVRGRGPRAAEQLLRLQLQLRLLVLLLVRLVVRLLLCTPVW